MKKILIGLMFLAVPVHAAVDSLVFDSTSGLRDMYMDQRAGYQSNNNGTDPTIYMRRNLDSTNCLRPHLTWFSVDDSLSAHTVTVVDSARLYIMRDATDYIDTPESLVFWPVAVTANRPAATETTEDWAHYTGTTAWTAPGGDTIGQAADDDTIWTTTSADSSYIFSFVRGLYAGTTFLDGLVSSAGNTGIMFGAKQIGGQGADGKSSFFSWHSIQATTPAKRPKFVVYWTSATTTTTHYQGAHLRKIGP
jgi:hypothetical protein